MTQSTLVIMLAGSLKPPPFHTQLGLPRICLPLDGHSTLLHRWSSALESAGISCDLRIVVNNESSKDQLDTFLDHAPEIVRPHRSFEVVVEPAGWRGPAGIIADVSKGRGRDECIVAIEANGLAPSSIQPAIDGLKEDIVGIVGVDRNQTPNGVFAMRRAALEEVPDIGYFDLKEQLLPSLYARHFVVKPAYFDELACRIHDRRTYLAGVRRVASESQAETPQSIAPGARIDPSARIIGPCVIDSDVSIEAGAVVHESVVLRGSLISRDAIVSRSVLAPGALVGATERVAREVVPGPAILLSKYQPAEQCIEREQRRWRQPA